MRFYFPDSQDQVDPSFDFLTEQHSPHRVRQRDDRYAHEALDPPPYDGLLVSKPIVDGRAQAGGKYTIAQRNRLYREGAQRFFRLGEGARPLRIMGDCGAFTYVDEESPPYGVAEVIDFYDGCRFDLGIAVDHVVFGYDAALDARPSDVPADWADRRTMTLHLAEDFIAEHRRRRCRFEPVGAAHGWSPLSYADSVARLQRMGYTRVALGGMVPLRTPDILASLRAVSDIRAPGVQIHLLGVTRTAYVNEFATHGVTSFDSTSPFRQAFKDDKANYHTAEGAFVAIRIPQVDGNTRLRRRVLAGQVDQAAARRLERACLDVARRFDAGTAGVGDVLGVVRSYSELLGDAKDRSDEYGETLEASPWKACPCAMCRTLGIDVVLFRGAERNRRRGFHNLAVFADRLQRELGVGTPSGAVA